ncbi:TetR/AcrR family transcriptional regulator [Streptomyces sp. NBC_00459]|uniref:TetR/AcrR family transcriptional regulator n=1 Tax=Streptomyces sp. NBC_00459 TaxID=2975749 RepID=UPI002E175244
MPATRRERGKTERYYRMRENVVDVAVELFSKRGYADTGVADIGEAAGLARGALYYYIGSKDALLVEIHDRVMDPLLKEAAAIVELDLSFETRLRLLSECLLWQIVNKHDHVWVFLHEYRQLQGEYRELFREKRQRFESRIRGLLADGHRRGLLQGRPQEDLELATLAFLNLHNYTYQWLAGHRVMRVEELSAFYCDIFFNGILAEPLDQERAGSELEQGRSVLRELRGVKPEAGARAEA